MGVTAPERISSLTERLRAAQKALASAEAAAGVRTALPQISRMRSTTTPPSVPSVPSVPSAAGGVAAGGVAVSDRLLPVPEALASLVPYGGLRRGSVVRVEGSTSLLVGMAAAACRDGAWCAVVGMPDLGLAAAAELGLPLDRVVLVPAPGADTPAVLGVVIDGFDVIVLGDVPYLVDRDRRHLASRLRHREAVLLTAGAWPGMDLVLSVTESRWSGAGQGFGSLRERDVTIRIGGRGAAGGAYPEARLHSPDGVRLVSPGAGTGVPAEHLVSKAG